MFKKPLIIATTAVLVATATFSTQAKAGDPILGALLGGVIGAAIGHGADGRHGARVGGAIGAIAGASIASQDRYYDGGYSDGGYYAPSYGYGYAPVYPRATIVYRSEPSYRYARNDRRDWRDHRYDRRDDRRDHRRDWR